MPQNPKSSQDNVMVHRSREARIRNSHQASLGDVIDAFERIMDLFKLERALYLIFGIVSLVLFVYAAIKLLSPDEVDAQVVNAMLGASGVMAACSARVVFFLNKAFGVIEQMVLGKVMKQEDNRAE